MLVKRISHAAMGLAVTALSSPAYASGTGMPWENPLQQILGSVMGPVSLVIGALSVVGLGFAMSMGENGGLMRKALFAVCGLSLAFSAVTWVLPFLGFSSGLSV